MKIPKVLVPMVVKFGPTARQIAFKAKKHLPEILVCAGTVSVVGGTVAACKATLDAKDILEDEVDVDVPEEEAKQLAMDRGISVAIGYLPAVGLVGGGVGMLVAAKSIEHRRFTAMLGAYSALQTTFNEYRERVKADKGEEADSRYFNGAEKVKVEIPGEDGKKPKKKEIVVFDSPENPAHRLFDECNSPTEWRDNFEQNLFFLKCQEAVLNQRLMAEKRIFLSDVYKMLGFPYHEAGQFLGWLADDIEGCGDGFISFGIEEACLRSEMMQAQEDGRNPNPSIWLNFNYDGEVWDKPLVKKEDRYL